MPEKSYSNMQLYKIAQDNYEILKRFCGLLAEEGYWQTAEKVLKNTATDILDVYVESLLVVFADYCRHFGETEKKFISALSDTAAEIIRSYESDAELIEASHHFQKNPPILFQLFSLRDVEKNSGTAALFFDALVNIMLSMAYLDGKREAVATKYLGIYFDRISAFLVNATNHAQSVDNKYIFKKLCYGDLANSANEIIASRYDFEKYKVLHLYYTSEQLKPVPSTEVNETYVERKGNTLSGKKIDPVSEAPSAKTVEEKKNEEKLLDSIRNSHLDELLNELNELVGLENVKSEIRSLINLIKVRKMRQEFKLPEIEMSYHMVFTGSPGTGKTTVARIVGKIYRELGILSSGTVTETDRAGLVAGYVGQTALKVKEVVEKSLGGVLFIDEAYTLANTDGNDFGREALDTLVKLMEDHRNDLVVIVAGYTEEMKRFLKSNTGLISRFNRFITFEDYSDAELSDIMVKMAEKNGFTLQDDLIESLDEYLSNMTEREKKDFGNARGIRNLFESMLVNQANRVVMSEACSMNDLTALRAEDASWV